MNNIQPIRAAIMASLMLIALLFPHLSLALAAEPIGSGALHVMAVGFTADPSQQNAPVNTGTAVDTTKVDPRGRDIYIYVA